MSWRRWIQDGTLTVPGLFTWLWEGASDGEGAQESGVGRLIDEEFAMYNHHLRMINGKSNKGWLRNLSQYCVHVLQFGLFFSCTSFSLSAYDIDTRPPEKIDQRSTANLAAPEWHAGLPRAWKHGSVIPHYCCHCLHFTILHNVIYIFFKQWSLLLLAVRLRREV